MCYFSGMCILFFMFVMSMKELGMFLIFIFISVVVLLSVVFYVEVSCGNKCVFLSILDVFWWVVNMIIIVGYGD